MSDRRAVTSLLLCAMLGACAAPPLARPGASAAPLPGSITAQADDVELSRQILALLPADLLLLGEQHDAPEHQQLQAAVVRALAGHGALAAVALEMAEQGASTAGLPTDATEAQAREALRWNTTAWPWAAYGPVVMTAVRAGVPVNGANLSAGELAVAVVNGTLDGHLSAASWQKQQKNIREGHCDLLPEAQVAPMTRVQTARDAAMARTITAARQAGKTVLLIAGNGHVDRELGVPTHLPPQLHARVLVLRPGRSGLAGDANDPAVRPDAIWETPALPPRDYCAELRPVSGR